MSAQTFCKGLKRQGFQTILHIYPLTECIHGNRVFRIDPFLSDLCVLVIAETFVDSTSLSFQHPCLIEDGIEAH